MAALGSCRSSTSSRTTNTAWAPSVERASAATDSVERGDAFGIPGEQVDGMDVLAVKAAGEQAVEHCRARQGPVHPRDEDLSLSRPLDVRSGASTARKEEVRQMRSEHDPIDHVAQAAAGRQMASTRTTFKAIDDEVRRRSCSDAAEFAQHSPEPDPAELWTDVLVEALSSMAIADPDARAVADHDRGQARQVAEEGRRRRSKPAT